MASWLSGCRSLPLDADPFMLHLYAALAEEERRLSERTKVAWQRRRRLVPGSAIGAIISRAGELGRSVQTTAANQSVASIMPVIQAIRGTGATTLKR